MEPPPNNLQSLPLGPGPSSRASSKRSPRLCRTSGTACQCGGTAAAAGRLSTPPSGTARLVLPLTCLWTSSRGCYSREPSPPGSTPISTLSHRTSWRSSAEDTPKAGAPPTGQRWPCIWLRCWSRDITDQHSDFNSTRTSGCV